MDFIHIRRYIITTPPTVSHFPPLNFQNTYIKVHLKIKKGSCISGSFNIGKVPCLLKNLYDDVYELRISSYPSKPIRNIGEAFIFENGRWVDLSSLTYFAESAYINHLRQQHTNFINETYSLLYFLRISKKQVKEFQNQYRTVAAFEEFYSWIKFLTQKIFPLIFVKMPYLRNRIYNPILAIKLRTQRL